MKKKLFGAMLLLALVLTGCKDESSAQTESENRSENSSSEIVSVEVTSEDVTSAITEEYPLLAEMDVYDHWPSVAIETYLREHNVLENVPSLPDVAKSYVELTLDDPSFPHYLTIFIPGTDRGAEYSTILEAVNFVVSNDETDGYHIALNTTETIQVDYFYNFDDFDYPDGMFIFIEALDKGALPEGIATTFDFATENQITKRDANQSIWTEASITMTIDKGASTVNVGNLTPQNETGYFTNPLRIYAAQIVTFDVQAGGQINGFIFETAGLWEKGDSVSALVNSLPVDANYSVDGDNVILNLEAPTSTYAITLSAQSRLNKISVYVV
ncbi:MAG: hypothetical protein BWX74_00545 [Tenericutes bacterium ADurb.Bin087]|nr:MAG: hypothetical protein BWX74_00545 [Tenericutes bacterium ADurb.Bin087]